MAQAVGRVADALTRIASAIEAHREAISEPDGGPDARQNVYRAAKQELAAIIEEGKDA